MRYSCFTWLNSSRTFKMILYNQQLCMPPSELASLEIPDLHCLPIASLHSLARHSAEPSSLFSTTPFHLRHGRAIPWPQGTLVHLCLCMHSSSAWKSLFSAILSLQQQVSIRTLWGPFSPPVKWLLFCSVLSGHQCWHLFWPLPSSVLFYEQVCILLILSMTQTWRIWSPSWWSSLST